MSRDFRQFLLLLGLAGVTGCTAEAPLRETTTAFQSCRETAPCQITIAPIYVGRNRDSLSGAVTVTDRDACRDIITELTFPEHPQRPKALDHAGYTAACKAIIEFPGSRLFCVLLLVRRGRGGSGIEYALVPGPDMTSGYDERLPGNYELGRGYSVALYGILDELITAAGQRWVPP